MLAPLLPRGGWVLLAPLASAVASHVPRGALGRSFASVVPRRLLETVVEGIESRALRSEPSRSWPRDLSLTYTLS